jgi:hypothetical protein
MCVSWHNKFNILTITHVLRTGAIQFSFFRWKPKFLTIILHQYPLQVWIIKSKLVDEVTRTHECTHARTQCSFKVVPAHSMYLNNMYYTESSLTRDCNWVWRLEAYSSGLQQTVWTPSSVLFFAKWGTYWLKSYCPPHTTAPPTSPLTFNISKVKIKVPLWMPWRQKNRVTVHVQSFLNLRPNKNDFFFHGAAAPGGPEPPHYRGFTMTLI